VQRIWRREGLKVPKKQKPRGGLWLNDGSCIRLRPERRNHVWSYDFVEAQTHDGRKLRLMTLIDEFTRECLAIRVARRINSLYVLPSVSRTTSAPEKRVLSRLNGWPMRSSVNASKKPSRANKRFRLRNRTYFWQMRSSGCESLRRI
jgi:hypothetical protein